jgi:hypothetical protein
VSWFEAGKHAALGDDHENEIQNEKDNNSHNDNTNVII